MSTADSFAHASSTEARIVTAMASSSFDFDEEEDDEDEAEDEEDPETLELEDEDRDIVSRDCLKCLAFFLERTLPSRFLRARSARRRLAEALLESFFSIFSTGSARAIRSTIFYLSSP